MSRRQSTPVLKDSYGFVVKRDHHELFKQYAPIWAKEEVERANLWTTFLLSFAPDAERDGDSTADQLGAACEAGLEPFKAALEEWRKRRSGPDSGSAEMPDWLPQLRCLVQAGVPRALRGRLWQAFLCLDAKREPGMYEQLVQKALGNTKYGRKRSQTSGDLDFGAVPAAPSTEAPSSYRSQHSSDTELQSTAYAPAAASAPGPAPAEAESAAAAADEPAPRQPSAEGEAQAAEAGRQEGAEGAAEPEAAAQPAKLNVRRTTSTSHASVASSDGGRRSHRSAEPWHPSTNDWNVQIEKDLHRTFPGHPVMNRSGRGALRRILAAYSRRNEAVGYCQGMNFIAGIMLLFMEEEDAFWAMAAVVEDLLPGYFNMDLIAPQVDQAVFKHLVDQRFPTLCAHLTRHGVNVASMALNWFLTMFVTSLPLEGTLRVWDVLFFDRCSSVLFRCALALVDIYAQALVATVDSIDAFTLLHAMAPMSFDASRLIDMACIAFAALTMDQIQALRKAYRTTVVASKLNDSSEDDDAAWASSDGEASSADEGAAPDSPTGPMGSGDYYSGSDDSDASEEEAITPSRLAQLSAKAASRISNLDDVRDYVRQIPSNELLAGITATQSTADLSPVSEASTRAEQPSPSPGGAAQAQSPAEQEPAAPGRSDGGLHAASAAASAVSRRLDRIASAHGAASRRLFGRKRSRNKGPAATGAAVLSGDAEALAAAAVAHKSSAAAEAAYHIAATPFKTLPLARLEPGSTPLVESLSPGDSIGDHAAHADGVSPSVTAAVTEGQQQASSAHAPSGSAAGRARRHIEAASSVVARTIGEAFGRSRSAELDPEGGRHAAAMAQLLSVVEGLEEELFAAEAACHEAEVEAAAAVRHSADARKELDAAVAELQERAKVVDALHDKLMGVNNTLAFFDGELQAKEKALVGVRAQIAERDQQIAHKDVLIAQLMAANPPKAAAPQANDSAASEAPKGGATGGGLFSKLRTNLARGPSTNGDVGSPLPTLSSGRMGSWSGLLGGRAAGDAPEAPTRSDGSGEAAARPPDGGPPAAAPQPESAAGSPAKAGTRVATAAAEAAGGQLPAAADGAAADDAAAMQPRNLDEELPPPTNLDAPAQPPAGDQQQQEEQQQNKQQAAKPAKDLEQLGREAQEAAAELHALDLDAEHAAKG